MAVALRTSPTYETLGDDELVAAVRAGEDAAFEALWQRYNGRIAAYAQRMLGDAARGEDVAQEVFISALRRMRSTSAPIAFKAWIYEIARNACIDAWRRSGRAELVPIEDTSMDVAARRRLGAFQVGPDIAAERRQELDDLRGAMDTLPESQHRLIVMRELEGRSYREIGERMGISGASVESGLFRARRNLSAEWEEVSSGRRCVEVQEALDEGLATRPFRERRRLTRHISHCHACRQQARLAGAPHSLGSRLAAFFPVPFLLRHSWLGQTGAAEAAGTGWTKGAAALVGVVAATAGGGLANYATSGSDEIRPPAPAPETRTLDLSGFKQFTAPPPRPAANRPAADAPAKPAARSGSAAPDAGVTGSLSRRPAARPAPVFGAAEPAPAAPAPASAPAAGPSAPAAPAPTPAPADGEATGAVDGTTGGMSPGLTLPSAPPEAAPAPSLGSTLEAVDSASGAMSAQGGLNEQVIRLGDSLTGLTDRVAGG